MKKWSLIKVVCIVIAICGLIYAYYPRTIYSKLDCLHDQLPSSLEIEIIKKDRAYADGIVAEVTSDKLQKFIDMFKEYKVIWSFWNEGKEYKNEIYIIKFKLENEELDAVAIGEKYVSVGYANYLPVGKNIDLTFLRSIFE
ncbi:hypothetical protein [Clostridium culturomicium]|uniref:hypothetical protein n=1 Tax=Clostridium culturomicium TaxID=1499683 RepID=UPI0038577403